MHIEYIFLFTHQEITPELLAENNCMVILTDHSVFDYEPIVQGARLIVDTRNVTRSFAHLGNIRFL